MVGAMAVGIARAAYERARAFALEDESTRVRPGTARARDVERTLDKDARKLEAARLLCWRAAWMADEGIPNSKEASMSKAYAAQSALEICADAVEVMGASGVRHDAFVEKWFRDIKVFDIFEGTGQIQRVVIAKRLVEGLKSF
jgi:acyl-CoA dehydrogenase